MIIIGDTSVLTHLARTELLFILRLFFKKVIIPREVFAELQQDKKERLSFVNQAIEEGWIVIKELKQRSLTKNVGLSNVDNIVVALAIELRADALLTDDKKLRALAESMGIKVIMTMAILVSAKQKGLIKQVKVYLDQLVNQGFYLDKKTYEQILNLAKE